MKRRHITPASEHASASNTLLQQHRAFRSNAPFLEGIDMIVLAAVIVITLGPLAAYAFGFGL